MQLNFVDKLISNIMQLNFVDKLILLVIDVFTFGFKIRAFF